MTIDNDLIDNLLKDYKKPEDIIGENGLLKQLTKAVAGAGHSRRVDRPRRLREARRGRASKVCRCVCKM